MTLPFILINALLFASVFLVIYALFSYPVPTEPPIHRRIALALGTGRRETAFEQPALAPLMSLALATARRFGFPALRDFIRRKLNASGNPNSYSIEEYLALALGVGVALAAVSAALVMVLAGQFDPLIVFVAAAMGLAIPLWTLHEAANRRVMRISKQLPYTLDLIALMMAAGSTFSEAIDTVIRDNPEDDFNQELRIVQAEIDFGTSRANALANMAERIPLDTLRSIVGAVNQAEALGTPLSTILMSQSSMLRMHRSVRAEKLSAAASLRILIPTVLILFAIVLILFGPMIVRGDLWRLLTGV